MSAGNDVGRTLRRAPSVEWVVLDGDAVLYDTVSETLHHLNRSATAVWGALDGRSDADAIVAFLLGDEPNEPAATASVSEGVRATLARLRAVGLVLPTTRPEAADDVDPSPA